MSASALVLGTGLFLIVNVLKEILPLLLSPQVPFTSVLQAVAMLLPFGLVDTTGWMTPLVVGFVSYTFFALEALTHAEIAAAFAARPAVSTRATTVTATRLAVAVALAHHHARAGLVLVDAHGQVTDHVFVDPGLALELRHDGARALDVQQHEVRLAVAVDLVGEVLEAPGLGLGHLAVELLDDLGGRRGQRVDLSLAQVLAREKDVLV